MAGRPPLRRDRRLVEALSERGSREGGQGRGRAERRLPMSATSGTCCRGCRGRRAVRSPLSETHSPYGVRPPQAHPRLKTGFREVNERQRGVKKAFATLAMCAGAGRCMKREVRGHACGDRAANGKRDCKSYMNCVNDYQSLSLGVVGSCLPSSSVTGTGFWQQLL